jgi:5-methylcytosine-specific restriction endonuclease McrA
MRRDYVSPALRQAVAERAGHRCCYCQTAENVAGSLFTVDHVIPESLGGHTTLDNLCLACWSCNLTRHDRIVA